jgi:DNA modification methylase
MSTAVACINTNRKGIMIEKDEHYYNIGKDRVIKAMQDKGWLIDKHR